MQTKHKEIVEECESLRVSVDIMCKHLIDLRRAPCDVRYLEVRQLDFHNRFTRLLELIEED
jgi:predicted secreted Zn-dependent protease